MTKLEARKQLNLGYIIFIIGFIFGILIHKKIEQNVFYSSLMFGYFSWATYWGYKIIYIKISNFFYTPIHIEVRSIKDYFTKTIIFKYTIEFVKFWICYTIGAFGGGFFKQIQLSKIAYF